MFLWKPAKGFQYYFLRLKCCMYLFSFGILTIYSHSLCPPYPAQSTYKPNFRKPSIILGDLSIDLTGSVFIRKLKLENQWKVLINVVALKRKIKCTRQFSGRIHISMKVFGYKTNFSSVHLPAELVSFSLLIRGCKIVLKEEAVFTVLSS